MLGEDGKDIGEKGLWNPKGKRDWSTFSDVTKAWRAETLEDNKILIE